MDEIQVKEFVIKARKLWQILSNKQKIVFLHYCADKTGSINRWDKMIIHPMTDFDILFQSYSPSELDAIFHNSDLHLEKPFTQEALYFVYDKIERRITPVYKPEEALSVVFEKMVREVGVEKMLSYLNEAFPAFPSLDKGLFLVLQQKELKQMQEWIQDGQAVAVTVLPLANGFLHLELEHGKFSEKVDGSKSQGDK